MRVVGGHDGALLFALRCFFAWSPTILFVTTQQFHQIATMMKLAITALLAGSAAAFAPAQSGRVATDLAVSELEVRLLFSTKRLCPSGGLLLPSEAACLHD